MLARLQVLPLVARRFFFDHTSQGKWLHELHGWSSLILKKLLQRTFLRVTWVTEGFFGECPWHDFCFSPGRSQECASHCTRRCKFTKKKLKNTNVFPFVACFSVGPELGHTAIEGNHPDHATSERLRVVLGLSMAFPNVFSRWRMMVLSESKRSLKGPLHVLSCV